MAVRNVLEVDVTYLDIARGDKGDPEGCPIYNALLPHMKPIVDMFKVERSRVDVFVGAHVFSVDLPRNAKNFILLFDHPEFVDKDEFEGEGEIEVGPITFVLDDWRLDSFIKPESLSQERF